MVRLVCKAIGVPNEKNAEQELAGKCSCPVCKCPAAPEENVADMALGNMQQGQAQQAAGSAPLMSQGQIGKSDSADKSRADLRTNHGMER